MDRENIEQALIKKPIAKNGTEFYGADDIMGSSVTPLLLFSTFVAISASFTFGCATGYSSAAQTGIVADLGLSTAQYSIFGSMLTFGSMFGAIASGKLADLVGRKPGAWYLHLGRLSLGFGSGIQSYLTPVYVAEITPKNIRGAFSAAHQAKIGKEKQFIDTLQCLRGVNADVTKEAAEIQESIETFSRLSRSRFMEMFEKKYALALTVVVGTLVIVTLGGSMGIVFYASSIFKVAGSPISFGTTAIAIIQVPVSALGVLILDRSGRRPVLMASLIGAGFGSFLVGSAFVLQDLNQLKELTPALVLIGVMINLSSFAMAAAIPWVIMSEVTYVYLIKGGGV
uniref:Major facilitator superfamily (MFS) profile domain-containing protein n=1 Tax=Daucus carota subsp. sativus TaxID=79200 RepID=A0A161ZUF0_DAUCS